MIIELWNYFRGHVVVEVSGFSVERFINLAINKNIYIWDIEHRQNKIYMKVSIRGYKSLKPICKKTKCTMKIKEKYGYPFFAFKYRKRKVFAIGIFSFIITLLILSNFIWSINIEGYKINEYTALKSFLDRKEIHIGTPKFKINSEEIEEEILNTFPNISWVNLYINGTKATLSIKETIDYKTDVKSNAPCNIIADKDGIITSIVTRTGKALVEKDDVVKKGDILVTGELKVKEDEFGVLNRFVSSDADIQIKKYYNISFQVDEKYLEKKFTGKEKTTYRFNVFNKNMGIKNYENYFHNSLRTSEYFQLNLGKDYPLPFILIKDVYKEFEYIEKTYTNKELHNIGKKFLNSRVLKEFSINIDIVDKTCEIMETKGGVIVKSKITAIESIGVIEPINSNVPIEVND